MSFSGGVYTLPGPALVTGEVVSATENNTFRNDVATAFNLTMLRNGTSTATANLPMGGYKLTGLGAPTTNGDALSYGKAAVVTTLTSTALTATRVPYAGTGGLLQDASTFTFDGTTLTAAGFSGPLTGNVTGNVSGNAGTVTNGVYTTGSYADPSWITSIAGSKVSGNISGNAATATTATNQSGGTVAATTGSFSSSVTLSGGTANGVAYLNGSKVLTTGTALTFDGSNLGLGVVPSAWLGNKAFEMLGGAINSGAATSIDYVQNAYYNSGYKYTTSNAASFYRQVTGQHQFFTAPSGTAGNAISFTQAMTLDASGNLGIGTSSPLAGYRLNVANGFAGITNGYGWGGLNTGGTAYAALFGAAGDANFSTTGNNAVLLASGANNILFGTNGAERMRITYNGSVGVATSSPTNTFAVKGSTNLGNDDANTANSLHYTRISGYAASDGTGNRYGNYGKLILNSDGSYTVSARRFLLTSAYQLNNFAIIRSVDSSTDPDLGTSGAVSSGYADVIIDNVGNFHFNSGYGSAGVAYGCRAWVNFNGTGTVAIRGSGNVSSITDNGTGDYTVNFAGVMPDANYSVNVTASDNGWVAATRQNVTAPTTSAVRIGVFSPSASNDATFVNVAVFR